jgi:hypothetical protein
MGILELKRFRPAAAAMQDAKNFNALVFYPVHNDVRRFTNNQFPRFGATAGAAYMRVLCEPGCGSVYEFDLPNGG